MLRILFTTRTRHQSLHDVNKNVAKIIRKNHKTMTIDTDDRQDPIMQLLTQSPVVINVGLEGFATDLQSQDVAVTHLDWRPPAGGDAELANLLSLLGS